MPKPHRPTAHKKIASQVHWHYANTHVKLNFHTFAKKKKIISLSHFPLFSSFRFYFFRENNQLILTQLMLVDIEFCFRYILNFYFCLRNDKHIS
jgi:hypothetical protein